MLDHDENLRTVTATGGRAVKLSKAEMNIYSAMVRLHPAPLSLSHIRANKRHVFVYRLRRKLRRLDADLSFHMGGYVLIQKAA